MKLSRRFFALFLAVLMLLPVSVISGISASAIAGGGVASSSYRAYGCDLSFWNVNGSALNHSLVNFAKMKADGCEFAILRIGFEGGATGVDTLDTAFLKYYENARAAGMPLGVYFYSHAKTYAGAKQDAEWVMSKIEQYGMYFEYPIYYDIEESDQTSLGSSAMLQLCLGWCETLEANGYFPGIYGGGSQVIDKLPSSFKSKYDLWYPKVRLNGHGTQYNPNNYDYSNYCNMWQYSWYDYEYDGIGLDMLDVNVCYKDYPTIMSTYGYNNCGTPIDKTALDGAIECAQNVSYKNYDETKLQAVRVAYDAACVVKNNSSASQEDVDSATTTLINALKNTSAKTVLSTGKSYTASNNTRTDAFVDNGSRLTDGVKGDTNGGNAYSGFTGSTEIVIDLGSVQKTDTYSAYLASGMWGIYPPDDFYFDVSVSTDGTNYTDVVTSSSVILTSGDNVYDESAWSTYVVTATSDKQVDARYVKILLDNNDSDNSQNIWVDEVEVGVYTGAHINNGIYVSGINSMVGTGETKIFTNAFNSGTITVSTANHAWTANVVASYSSQYNAYVVKSSAIGTGTGTADITLASGDILIAAHGWEGSSIEDPVGDSMANFNKVSSLKAGDVIGLSGINTDYSFINIGAYVSIGGANSDSPVVNPGVEQLEGGKTFWLTHYNDNTAEGSGVVFTEAYTGAAWWLHIAFAPTSVANVYKITAVSDGTDAGDGTALAIPDGGFVYCLNYGNDYPTINGDGTGIDYTSTTCNNALKDALTWKVGTELKISGLDLDGKSIPTSTVGTNWYDDAYVCTANYVKYVADDPTYDTTVYDNMLWLTHFNDLAVEGAGVIVTTDGLLNGSWNNYYAFAPVDGSNAYELVEVSIGIDLGTSVIPSVPAGGFVYSINVGNNYPELYAKDPVTYEWCKDMPDYTSDNCNAMVEIVKNWEVGKQYRFGNLDLAGETIPSSTSSLNWYEDGYVCTATFEPVSADDDNSDNSGDDWLYGDVNADGDIDQLDYLLVKRAYFNTYTLSADEAKRADVDRSMTIDAYDYVYIKRHYFGTYTIIQNS